MNRVTRGLIALIRLYPRPFRERFGTELAEQIRRECAEAEARGWRARWSFVLGTATDVVVSAIAERVDPVWDDADEQGEWGMASMTDGWVRDLWHAVRSLRRAPGFAVVAVSTLAIAIGANVGIFSVVDAVLLRPLPYTQPDRLVALSATAPGSDMPDEFRLGAEFMVALREQSKVLQDVAVYNDFTSTLRVGDRVERVPMSFPSTSTFALLGAKPMLGRVPVDSDHGTTVVLSHKLWTTWFDRDPTVLGRTIDAGGDSRTVVGVMGPDFWFPDDQVLLWGANPMDLWNDASPGRFDAPMIARLRPGADAEEAVAEIARITQRIPERFGGSPAYAKLIGQIRPIVRPLEEQLVGAVARPLWVLLGAVALVLLIACANVANLFIVRAERRQRDLAVRQAIGAGRAQLIRSQLAESVVIAAVAGPLALVLAWATVPLFLRAAPPIPRLSQVALGLPAILFTLGACAFCVLVCGLAPAIRGSKPRLSALRDGGRGSTTRRHWARDGLVVGQTALALVLLIGSGLLVRSFWTLRHVDPGYDTRDVLTFQIAPDAEDLVDGPSYARFHMAFMDRLRALPGVTSVGVVDNVPLNESTGNMRFLPESAAGDAEGGSLLNFTFTGGDYFTTMGIELLKGRVFTRDDQIVDHGNIIVSASAARLLWGDQDPLGRRIRRVDGDEAFTVVGVVHDVLQYGFRDVPQPLIYLPLVGPEPRTWLVSSPAYVVKSPRAEALVAEIRALVHEVAPSAPMYRVYTMEKLAADSMVQLSFTTLTLGVASVLALLLGALGLYGVLSYTVAARTQEIGIRMALGAEARRVQAMVVGQGTRVVLIGIVVGVVAAFGVTRVLESLLYGVGALDPTIFLAMSAAMIAVGALASWLPARRASNVDPVRSLTGG